MEDNCYNVRSQGKAWFPVTPASFCPDRFRSPMKSIVYRSTLNIAAATLAGPIAVSRRFPAESILQPSGTATAEMVIPDRGFEGSPNEIVPD